jgi:ADP-heptose:LPS heptosyltransferase
MAGKRLLPYTKFLTSKGVPLREYYEKRNRLLVIRDTGGLGDILMLRMIFEDFHRYVPGVKIVVAAPTQYHDVLKDHPFIDEVIDSTQIELSDFVVSYNLTSACGKYELKVAPMADKHRSDIWASHCGIELEQHNMHLSVDAGITEACRAEMERYRTHEKGPIILISPVSAIRSKDLAPAQANGVITELRKMGYFVLAFHKHPLKKLKVPTICAKSVIDFLGFINASAYIITVDSAPFHAAGGLGKPQTAVFSWADGKVYGKWYDKYVLVQHHRDNGDWNCGPCYRWFDCPKEKKGSRKPCITSITVGEIVDGAKEMIERWPHGK